jgi:hypothetical protein
MRRLLPLLLLPVLAVLGGCVVVPDSGPYYARPHYARPYVAPRPPPAYYGRPYYRPYGHYRGHGRRGW